MTTSRLITLLALMAASMLAVQAQAHAVLERAAPQAGSELQIAPKEIRLRFNETLEPAFSKIVLLDANNIAVALPKTVIAKTHSNVISSPLPLLKSGQYRVRWTTMTHDGHKVKGEYTFKVK